MRKIIDGKIYNTDTAEQICDVSPSGFNRGDFEWEDTRLYRTAKGAFFLSGEGGPRSRWAKAIGQNGWGGGRGLALIDDEEAKLLIEQHVPPSVYVEIFGEVEEG